MAKEQARMKARNLLQKQEIAQAPVNVVQIAQKLGYKVYRATFKKPGISGGVKFLQENQHQGDQHKGEIYVNAEDAPRRQRFTIAHEIGHCIMHREQHQEGILEKIDMFRNPENHNAEEAEANEFAASLLMPEYMVRDAWKRWGSTEILADIFKVSISAMSYRLYNLGLKGDW